MNALEAFAGSPWWHVAGWTMLHYLWVGALVGVVAAVLRFAVRRASANVRYAVAVGSLVVLAVLPVGIGVGVGFQVSGVREEVEEDTRPSERIVELSRPAAPEPHAAPGSAGGIVDLARSRGPMETAPAFESQALSIPTTDANPRQSRGLAGEYDWQAVVEFSAAYLPWVWIVGAPLTFLLLTTGVVGAERLRRASRPITDGPVAETAARIAASLRITRHVTIAVCERIAAPLLVGIVRPMILLPPAVLTGWSPEEIEMVLLHELAHVRRWDNLVNLLQRLVEAVLFFQPAVWLVSGWVRREREACCDAVVVGRTNRPHAYAELLVEFAAMMSNASEPGRPRPRLGAFTRGRGRPGSLVSSAMAAGPLRGRIRRILGIEDDPLLISGKSLGVVMSGLLLAATLVVLNLTTSTQAEEELFTTEDTEDTEDTEEVKAEVPFVVGASKFADGDSITITQVRGPSNAFEPGGIYWIEGTYKLASRERASLSAFVTARNAGEGRTSIDKKQTMIVERGSGRFALELPMPYEGWPHVSYYPAEGGEGFGGVYFGTGDSVLKKWWGEKELTTEGTESTERKIDIAKKRAATQNNLKNLMLAILNYEAATRYFPTRAQFDANGKPLLSWRVLVLPYLGEEEAKLYSEFRLNEPWDSEHNRKLIARMPKVFKHPRIDKPGMTNYLAVVGEECVFGVDDKLVQMIHVMDGTSHTIALVEADADRAVEWTKPEDWEFDRERPTAGLGGLWPNGWYAAWVDGHISLVSNNESPDHVGIQFTRAGGETESLSESAGRADGMMMGGRGGMGMEGGMSRGTGMEGGTGRGREGAMGGRGGEMGMAGGEFGGEMGMGAAPVSVTSAKKFPTLEEQKLADAVYRRLGLELEPLDEQDLRRVQTLGYNGGMKVTQNDGSVISWETIRGGILPNDILVGLHVWPTRSAADVVQVLERDDLAELNPLKFYLVRQVEEAYGMMGGMGGGRGMEGAPLRDEVVTGRITVKATSKKESQPRVVAAAPTPIPLGTADENAIARPMDKELEEQLAADPNLGLLNHQLMALQYELSSLVSKSLNSDSKERAALKRRIAEAQRTISEYRENIRLQRNSSRKPNAAKLSVPRMPNAVAPSTGAPAATATAPTTPPSPAAIPYGASEMQGASELRYDGKTFDQWRTAWKTELSTERRLEAVKALAAFGANGQGKEAAEAIADVIEQLDWRAIDESSAGQLKQACVDAFTSGGTTGGYRIPTNDWLPLAIEKLRAGSEPVRMFCNYSLYQLPEGDRDAIQPLLALSQEQRFRDVALGGLKQANPKLDDPDVRARFGQVLTQPNENARTLTFALRGLLYNVEADRHALRDVPGVQSLLFHPNLQVRQVARLAVAQLQPDDASTIVKQLLAIVNDPHRAADRAEAIRAIAAVGEQAKPAEQRLIEIARRQDDPDCYAAAFAVGRICGKRWDDWSEATYKHVYGPDHQDNELARDAGRELRDESNALFSPNDSQHFQGGGVF